MALAAALNVSGLSNDESVFDYEEKLSKSSIPVPSTSWAPSRGSSPLPDELIQALHHDESSEELETICNCEETSSETSESPSPVPSSSSASSRASSPVLTHDMLKALHNALEMILNVEKKYQAFQDAKKVAKSEGADKEKLLGTSSSIPEPKELLLDDICD